MFFKIYVHTSPNQGQAIHGLDELVALRDFLNEHVVPGKEVVTKTPARLR